jgi:hypothetical protein
MDSIGLKLGTAAIVFGAVFLFILGIQMGVDKVWKNRFSDCAAVSTLD